MLALHELQSLFLEAVFANADAEATLLTHCVTAGGAPKQGLQTYRRGVLGQRRHALEASYPVLVQVVGPAFFQTAAELYGAQTPSRQGDLNRYGDTFADFLAAWPPAGALPYLGDLARLEWAVQRMHDAPDAETDPEAWRVIAPQDYGALRLRLHPACTRFDARWPVGEIWRAHQAHSEASRREALQAIDFSRPACELVSRTHARVQVRALGTGEAAWYDAIARGVTLSEALELALRRQPDFDVSTALLHAVHDGSLLPPPTQETCDDTPQTAT